MSTGQQVTAGVGVTLIALNFWQHQKPAVMAGAFSSHATPAQETAAHAALKNVALEALFVGVLTLMAGAGKSAASIALSVIVALGIVYAFHYQASTATATAPPASPHTPPRNNNAGQNYQAQ